MALRILLSTDSNPNNDGTAREDPGSNSAGSNVYGVPEPEGAAPFNVTYRDNRKHQRVTGNDQEVYEDPSRGGGFRSTDEMVRAMQDPRYKTDPAYRELVAWGVSHMTKRAEPTLPDGEPIGEEK